MGRLPRPTVGLGDPRLAAVLQEFVDRRFEVAIARRTGHRYGVVEGEPNLTDRTVSVRLMGQSQQTPGFHYGSGLAPRDGDFVRVYIDPRGDKWVDDLLGRDAVSEIIQVVTPPVIQPDRARHAIARIPVLVEGTPLVPVQEKSGLGGSVVMDSMPVAGRLLTAEAAHRGAGMASMSGWTMLDDCDNGSWPGAVYWRIADGVTNAFGLTGSGYQLHVSEWPDGATLDSVYAVHATPQFGSAVDAGGPLTPSVAGSTVVGLGVYTTFFTYAWTPAAGVVPTYDATYVNAGNAPRMSVGYRTNASSATVIDGTLAHTDGWNGITYAINGGPGSVPGIILEPAPEAIDADDGTYHVLSPAGTDQAEAIRIDLLAPYRIVRARIVIGCATAGAKSYELRAATMGDYSDEVVLATLSITAAGGYVPATLTPVWPSTTPYRYYRLVGPAEVRRVYTVELYETTAGETIVTDPTSGLGALIDAALAALAAMIVTDHGALTGLADDDHPQYTTAAELAAYAQPLDSDLTAIAALATTAFGRSVLTQANAAALRTLAAVVIGTDVQAYDAELAALAGLTSAADQVPYFTGVGTAALTGLSSFIRTLLDDADATTARATLGVGAGTRYEPLTSGASSAPELVFTADGRCVMVPVSD